MSSVGGSEGDGGSVPRRDSDASRHRTWSVVSGASGASDLPPGVRPPSASRVRSRQHIAMGRSKSHGDVLVKEGVSLEDKSATRIASIYRGHSARKVVQEKKETTAAVAVQSAFRGHVTRTEVAKKRQADRAAALAASKAAADKELEDRKRREAEADAARRAAAEAEAKRLRLAALERERLEAEARAAAMKPQAPPEPDPQLLRDLKDARDDLEAKTELADRLQGSVAAKDAQLRKRDKTIADLEEQRSELTDEVKEKDTKVASLADQIQAMADVLRERDASKVKLLARIAELEEKVAKLQPPPMQDVALDAKPIDDSVFLTERDNVIDRQAGEIKLLQAEIEKLMSGIDQVEDQVEVMQGKVFNRDELYSTKKRECEDLRAEIEQLKVSLKEANARDFAMDAATKQNGELLVQLQKADKVKEEALEERDDAKRHLEDFLERHQLRIREAAESEAKAVKWERDAKWYKSQLDDLQASVDAKVGVVATKLDTTTKTAAVQLDTMSEELRLRRQKQYELLDKIRALEEAVDDATNRADAFTPQVQALQQRNLELESQLAQANQWRQGETHAARAAEQDLKDDIARRQEQLEHTEKELAVVKSQMTEMSSSVVRLAEKEQGLQQLLDKANEKWRSKDGELAVMQERVAQLADEAMRADRERLAAEERSAMAVESLTSLQKEHAALLTRTRGMITVDRAAEDEAAAATAAAGGGFGPQTTMRGGSQWEGSRTLGPAAGEPPSMLSMTGASRVSTAGGGLGGGGGGSGGGGGGGGVEIRRAAMRRIVHMHCGTASLHTAASPPSHLLAPDAATSSAPVAAAGSSSSGAVGDTAIPVASLLFGADMFGNPVTSTRAGVGSYISASVASTMPTSAGLPLAERGHDVEALRTVGLLDLSGLGLLDLDIAVLVHTMARLPMGVDEWQPAANSTAAGTIQAPRPLKALDLRNNGITDVGAVLLARLLSGTSLPECNRVPHVASKLALLDLRGNALTSVGVRALAEALRGNANLRVQHVYVGGDGFVRALGIKSPGGDPMVAAPSTGQGVMGIVAVFDLRGNAGTAEGDPQAKASELLGAVDADIGLASGMDTSPFRPETIDRKPPPPPAGLGGGGPTGDGSRFRGGGGGGGGGGGNVPPPVAPGPSVMSVGFAGTDVGPFHAGSSLQSSAGSVRWASSAAPEDSHSHSHHRPSPHLVSSSSSSSALLEPSSQQADHLLAMAAADDFLGTSRPPDPSKSSSSKSSKTKRRKSKTSSRSKLSKSKSGVERVSSADSAKKRTAVLKASPYSGSADPSLPSIPPKSR